MALHIKAALFGGSGALIAARSLSLLSETFSLDIGRDRGIARESELTVFHS